MIHSKEKMYAAQAVSLSLRVNLDFPEEVKRDMICSELIREISRKYNIDIRPEHIDVWQAGSRYINARWKPQTKNVAVRIVHAGVGEDKFEVVPNIWNIRVVKPVQQYRFSSMMDSGPRFLDAMWGTVELKLFGWDDVNHCHVLYDSSIDFYGGQVA